MNSNPISSAVAGDFSLSKRNGAVLPKKKEILTEFNEGLWCIMVDTMTVYSKEKVVFKFRDGTTAEWKIG